MERRHTAWQWLDFLLSLWFVLPWFALGLFVAVWLIYDQYGVNTQVKYDSQLNLVRQIDFPLDVEQMHRRMMESPMHEKMKNMMMHQGEDEG